MEHKTYLNKAVVSGVLTENFELDHTCAGVNFYKSTLQVDRRSENSDHIPMLVPEWLLDLEMDYRGKFVKVFGQVRTYNKKIDGRNHVLVRLFAKYLEVFDEEQDHENYVQMRGFLTISPTTRITPNGRIISDAIVAVNREYKHSDYIPCIFWGKNAVEICKHDASTELKITGRIQSRQYMKLLADGGCEARTAYEISVGKMEVKGNE